MDREVWFRNPQYYIRELVEVGGPYRIIWDRGILVKKKIDPVKHAKLYLGPNADVRILVAGAQGTVELDYSTSMEKPKAVYPTWEFGEDIDILEDMIAYPYGKDAEMCLDMDTPPDQRPIIGQEHRVVITKMPNAQRNSSRKFYRLLKEMQDENPECVIHVHGTYSYRVAFGQGYRSADIDPRTAAAQGRVTLPNGSESTYERVGLHQKWVNALGMSIVELKEPRKRCIYNIRSAKWASKHWDDNIDFKSRGKVSVDPDSPVTETPTTSKARVALALAPSPGNKVACDVCSLAIACKYFRTGAVCSVPGTESKALVDRFKSRDSGQIIDALGTIVGAQAERLERGMKLEEDNDELDPEVTKMMNQLFANGVKLAKLVDPNLNKPLVTVNNGAAQAVAGSNPKQMMAQVVRELESQGYKREEITPGMVEAMLRGMVAGTGPKEIEK